MTNDALKIINSSIKSASPYDNVVKELKKRKYPDNVTVVAVGKAACSMATGAYDVLGKKIKKGFIITKYNHSENMPSCFTVREAGHPVPDDNSVKYTSEILDYTNKLSENDFILFLLSGGASALFEKPAILLEELKKVTDSLLRCSADITEINAIRKRLSLVKGGKFALNCKCHIDCCILSDVLGDRLDMIASGPCFEDSTSDSEIQHILNKYNLHFSDEINNLIFSGNNARIKNVTAFTVGNIELLCNGAAKAAEELGYKPIIVTTKLTGEARIRGTQIAAEAVKFSENEHIPTAFIYGGETTVTVRGKGKGGRNQELALAAAEVIAGHKNLTIFSIGSDGTDGPTDAAGGIVNGNTLENMIALDINTGEYLNNNNSYNALKKCGCLVVTGATGTNVNDLTVALVR